TIPPSVTSIGDSAFSSCSNLQSITKETSDTGIGHAEFYYIKNSL
ncbi:MAG: leucine-rich repeat domain-containing protein, partial [Clostridia bacterium]|nr:leucine-rich repeat domain-containing protein [Clostridia bacterium]